jgi:dCMP deaminase
MNVAMVVAERSLCDRDKVGAVVVDYSNRIVDTGYNGPPRGFNPMRILGAYEIDYEGTSCHNWCHRAIRDNQGLDPNYEDCPSLHAEANALMFSDRRHREGGTIYITSGVCGGCAKLIANSGLARVVCDITHAQPHRDSSSWFDFMRNCGLIVDEMRH